MRYCLPSWLEAVRTMFWARWGIVVAGIVRLEHGTARCAAQDQGQEKYLKKDGDRFS